MKNVKIKDILKICEVEDYFGDLEYECINFSKDTRTIQEGDTYIGIKGENFDGNKFFDKAFENGASTCVVQAIEITEDIRERFKEKNLIVVKDTMKALAKIAEYKLSLYDIPVIAITGSVGKTSTKDIIASVVAEKYNILKTEGNNNNEIGLPFTILRLKDEDAIVLEMGMNNKGEIERLSKIAKPDVAVITNVGTSHIGNLGSRENILLAKMEITSGMKENGTLIVNKDNDMLQKAEYRNIETYGIENDSKYMAKNIRVLEDKSYFDIEIDGRIFEVEVPIPGEHFVYNSLSAIAVGMSCKIEMEKIIEGIRKFKLTKGRMELIKTEKGYTIINDAYNASFDSMKSGIEYLNRMSGNQKIAVLGDMLELGDFSKELHEKVGEIVAENNIDKLIVLGEFSRNIARIAIEKGMNRENIYQCENTDQVIATIKDLVKENDIVYFKASNAMNFSKIISEIK